MRVLQFICSTGFYGAERWILALANHLDRSVVTSHLAVTRESVDHRLELTDRYSALRLPAHELSMSGRFDLRIVKRLCDLIRRERIDIVHTHGYKSDILGLLAARRTGIASVCTPHGFENSTDAKLRLYIRLGSHTFRYFDRVVPLSPELCADVRRLGVSEERIRYIANGLDLEPVVSHLERAAERAGLAIAAPEPGAGTGDDLPPGLALATNLRHRRRLVDGKRTRTMGFIGQLVDRKNVRDIIETFDAIACRDPDLRLMLIGDGDARNALQAFATSTESSARISFLGFVPDPLVHLSDFDLFVMTSSLEGIPRCMMEAMSMGVPVAAYRIPGIDQLIEHEQSGLLAEYGDRAQLRQHCERLLFDDSLAERMATNAQRHVARAFSADRMAREYLALYTELVTERQGRAGGRSS